MRKVNDQLIVQVPSAAQDRPSWKTIGIIAAVGFSVGVIWPRLAGVRLGPSVPDVGSSAAPSPSASTSVALATPPPAVASAPPSIATSAPLQAPAARSVASTTPPAPAAPPTVAPPTVAAPPTAAPPAPPAAQPTRAAEHPPPTVETSPAAHAAGNSSDGTAQVVWATALIREAPKTGKILARLPRGTTIRIGPVKDGWYPVKPGNGFAGEGWVFREAIGR